MCDKTGQPPTPPPASDPQLEARLGAALERVQLLEKEMAAKTRAPQGKASEPEQSDEHSEDDPDKYIVTASGNTVTCMTDAYMFLNLFEMNMALCIFFENMQGRWSMF